MASKVVNLFSGIAKTTTNCKLCNYSKILRLPNRTYIQTNAGAMLSRPDHTSLGVAKVLIVLIPFIVLGGKCASKGASLLEEYELFMPDDEDDD